MSTERKGWDPDEVVKLRQMVALHKSASEIAADLGRSEISIRSKAQALGLGFRAKIEPEPHGWGGKHMISSKKSTDIKPDKKSDKNSRRKKVTTGCDTVYDRVPEDLRNLRQWVCHRFPDKAPLCPFPDERGNLTFASCNKPETWGSFEAAVKAVSLGWAKGIGIEFANGIAGIDIDHCVDGGELSELAREIVETFRSYTEISPSGTGVHILFRGKLPGTGRKLPMLGLEVYDSGRYFTVTGNAYLDPDGDAYPLRDCTEELGAFYKRYFDNTPSEETKLQVKSTASPADAQKRAASTQRHLKLLSAIQETLGKAGTMMAENAGAPEAWRLFWQVQAGLGYLMDMIQQDASEVR